MTPHPAAITPIPAAARPSATTSGWARSPVALAAMSRPPIHAPTSYPASLTRRPHLRQAERRTRRHLTHRLTRPTCRVSASSLTQPPVLTKALDPVANSAHGKDNTPL